MPPSKQDAAVSRFGARQNFRSPGSDRRNGDGWRSQSLVADRGRVIGVEVRGAAVRVGGCDGPGVAVPLLVSRQRRIQTSWWGCSACFHSAIAGAATVRN